MAQIGRMKGKGSVPRKESSIPVLLCDERLTAACKIADVERSIGLVDA